jgi:predicted metal-binding membrane protein
MWKAMSARSSESCHVPATHFSSAPLPREGWVVGLLLLGLLGAAWAWLFRMDALGQILICRAQASGFGAIAGMWVVMMIAMMLPSALPMIFAFAQVTAERERTASRAGLLVLFVAAYLAVWSAFGVAAAAAEWLLQGHGLVRDGGLANPLYAGALLVVAGLYQWSTAKGVCLSRCRSPSDFVREHYRGGYRGAFALGLAHGAFCVGCCWVLMLLAWVGGTMNLAWMVVLTLFVAAERMLRMRAALLHASAIALLGMGAILMIGSGP